MTKEELEKESEEYALKQWEGQIPWGVIQKSYYDGAEPREKQIQIDVEQIRALQKQNGELTDRVRELEAQLENLKPYRCKNHFQVLETGNAVVCYRMCDCKSCGQFKEIEK